MPPVTPTTIRATGILWLLFVRRRKSAERLLSFAGRNPPSGFPPLGSPPSAGQIPEGVRSRGRNREAAAYDADASYANFSLPRAISSMDIVR